MNEIVTATDEAASFATHEAIAATLGRYLESARTGDGKAMRSAFLEGAHIRGSYGGKPVEWTLQAFCDVIDHAGPAADLKARIVSIEYQGTAAMARLEADNWRGTRYTDFFVLLKQGDEWRISSKGFFAHSRA
jgi:hypothetical protein